MDGATAFTITPVTVFSRACERVLGVEMKKVRKRINRNYDYASIYRFTQVEIEEALLMYLEQNRAETIDGGKSRKLAL